MLKNDDSYVRFIGHIIIVKLVYKKEMDEDNISKKWLENDEGG